MVSLHVPSRPSSRHQARRGLTLMELVVVLTVLAALSALVVPLLPNLLRRAHKSVDAAQSGEIAKAVQLHQATTLSYPNEWDMMLAVDGTVPNFIPSDGGTPFGGGATVQQLTTDEAKALGRVGITSGHYFDTAIGAGSSTHPTLNPYASAVTAPTGFAVDSYAFMIDGTNATAGAYPVEVFNILERNKIEAPSNPARFVVFGVGTRNTMVGKELENAPTSVPQNGEFTPATLYSRTGVIFQVSGLGIDGSATTASGAVVNGTERARFIGAVALEDDEIESLEKDLVNYYDIAETGQ